VSIKNYLEGRNVKKTPQTQPIPGTNQQQNSAGGYSFVVDDKTRLDRFLILGTEGGSYYSSAKKLTDENAKTVIDLIGRDGLYVVNRVVEISDAGRAPKMIQPSSFWRCA
jgi:60 kDa SS-A/Ro ribonucleoprotein